MGSIRRECLDHVIVWNEGHLRRPLASYFPYDHRWRTHLSLVMDCPAARPVQLPCQGAVVAFLEVGGLHHHYERRAAMEGLAESHDRGFREPQTGPIERESGCRG